MANNVHLIYLGLGSNLGNRENNLCQALEGLKAAHIEITNISSLYETEPVGYSNQGWFYNLVIEAKTNLEPQKLLETILSVEKNLGRERIVRFGPRTIDIDLLFYDNIILNEPGLTLPHPRLTERKFVLEPLVEIAPKLLHPLFQKTSEILLQECPDQNTVQKLHHLSNYAEKIVNRHQS